MFSTSDTIVAIATPPGRGGIGVVRLSGPRARPIAEDLIVRELPLEPRHATLTRLREAIDQAVVTLFPGPNSYTGDDVVELSAHGSPVVLETIVRAAIAGGARLANPGEFTLRAFLNGRIDLMQAEAVADLIDAATPLQARAAFDQLEGTLTRNIADLDARLFDLIAGLEASIDFPEEGYHFLEPPALAASIDELVARTGALLADARRGRMIREGLQIAIVGRPNVGKSSLFNALVGSPRAIVTDVPGTTRDLVTEVVDLDGLRVTLVDTAGLRAAEDAVEAEGIGRSRGAIGVADLVVHVVDARCADGDGLGETAGRRRVVARNKCDLVDARADATDEAVAVSALTGEGLQALRRAILGALDVDVLRDRPALTNVRHAALVQSAHDALLRAREAVAHPDGALSEEFVLADLQDARAAFEEITGRRAADELLAHIFARFCIGK
ncbi:MAG TPA: tRNA uridine-5-carboxymethylaminomethyl(34) synthesis GTPase MnmE [Vicinamibacterales bacterium]|nr:tRNA uridine-5-carboxymethylaminomethyl(34) synthesis GTPase MnmE [Vicinamibacterales bacterium]